MGYNKLNNYLGWFAFLIATVVYFLTVEQTASLWDCGEYITAAYKLEVGHPPGAPFFMLMGRIFSLFALGNEADVALWINRMSALSSSLSILFLFWTITLLGKKIAQRAGEEMTQGQKIAILGSGFVGAMAYTFTESFWFSAVEGEVYAMSSLFTAVIFWAALKWDEEMTAIKRGLISYDVKPLRWMVLIMFLFGLAIGVHLLGLLVLPAIAYIVMYNSNQGKEVDIKTFLVTGAIGIFILGFIQEGIIPGIIAIASKLEIFFVNSIGLPFFTGAIFFFMALIGLLVFGLIWTRKKGYRIANTAILGLVMLLIGYGSFATIVIRSNANPPLDENNPENLVTLHAYLKREQYGSWPILYGEYFNSKVSEDQSRYADRSPFYDKRHVVTTDRGSEIAAFREKEMADKYVENSGQNNLSVVHKYFETNKDTRIQQVPDFEQKTFFPRMFYRGDANRTRGYKEWSGYNPNRKALPNEIGDDNRPIPTFGNNLQFFVDYQINWMYWRYFMWNFSGRQNDIQGHGDVMRGNWISGFDFIDNARLGESSEKSPYFTQNNFSNNRFFFIPFVLGLFGLFFHYIRAPRDAFVVTLLFLFTGLAIVVYLNQKPFEPRERDYAYAASFYAFAIWIGLGVYGLYEAFKSYANKEYKLMGIIFAGFLVIGLAADANAEFTGGVSSAIVVIGAMGIGASALMTGLRKINFAPKSAALVATALGLIAPIILGMQGWDDHDRSNRSPARALAWNYISSVAPNGILFTNGDNDTFPLWYLQEVEGIRTDVRVANLSLMQTDWYTEQMMMKAYESEPLPIKFREDQILMGFGNTDYVLFVDQDVYSQQIDNAQTERLIQLKIEHNPTQFNRSINNFRQGLVGAIAAMTPKDAKVAEVLPAILEDLASPFEKPDYADYQKVDKILSYIISALNGRKLEADQELLKQLNDAAMRWTNDWDYLPIDIVMEFVRDDNNILRQQTSGRGFRFFPTKGFILPVNAENAVKAGIINEEDKSNCVDEIRFSFRKGGMFRSDVRGLSREEVMMLDILANFDWNRGISFSSPGGSDVAKALFAKSVLQNVGQIHSLSPLNAQRITEDATEKLYANVTELYDYGNLKEEGVLVDYYVRRHTSQYRSSYLDLAMAYGRQFQQAEAQAQFRNAADSLGNEEQPQEVNKAAEAADKVEEVIRHAMEYLPMDRVLDMGEPRPTSAQLPNGRQIYSDGIIPDFISILYRVGKTEYANEIADQYLNQIEKSFDYFAASHPIHAYNNQEDFISMTMNFMRVFRDAYTENDEGHPMAERASEMEDRLTRSIVPYITEGINAIEISETVGGRTRDRKMDREAQEFFELYQALMVHNGLMEGADSEN
jgi:hypothetical protein